MGPGTASTTGVAVLALIWRNYGLCRHDRILRRHALEMYATQLVNLRGLSWCQNLWNPAELTYMTAR